ncbi:parallel beta-helix domain-containing protein [Tepidicaulis sp. LMO-SS28]|uniref:parallel beta-helix domain-containing protein n=1 Tax=Tepidicaulis sp. LMO-SS28 TaxID=3447455 RepID=UPI003EE2ECB7
MQGHQAFIGKATLAILLWAGLAAEAQAAQVAVSFGEGTSPQEALQTALILAEPGDTLLLPAGTYAMAAGLSLDIDDVTLRGEGPEKTVLSFKTQEAGSEGLLVTSSHVTLEDFAIEDAKGDAIKAMGSDGITFRNLRVEWTNGPSPENGAYGLYPVSSKNVLIENCTAIGASDAGIYVGQSDGIIVRNSRALFNVAGIEIENSYRADVYGNEATRNTGGILVFDLPGLPQQGGHSVRVFGNKVHTNDTKNFAPEGNIVGEVPTGTGIMVMANRDVEIFDNDIANNGTVNVLIVAYPNDYEDEDYFPYPQGIHVHDNRFGEGGAAPDNEIGSLIAEIAGTPVPDIVWDGRMPWMEYFFGANAGNGLYIGGNESTVSESVTFADLNVPLYFTASWFHSVDRAYPDHAGEPATLAPVTLTWQNVTSD